MRKLKPGYLGHELAFLNVFLSSVFSFYISLVDQEDKNEMHTIDVCHVPLPTVSVCVLLLWPPFPFRRLRILL